jgi:hypothetical protein
LLKSCFFLQNIGNDWKSKIKKQNKTKSFMIPLGNRPKKNFSRLQIFYQWNQQHD